MTSCHLPGVENIEADRLSRSLNIDMEWKLNDDIFQLIDTLYEPNEVDLFASSCNYQIPRYFSYLPDARAEVIDAFTASWKNLNVYCFPPFSLLGRVMQKVKLDMTLIAPVWPNPSLVSRYFEQHSRGLVFDTEAKDALVSIPKSISHTSVNENEFSCFSDIGKLLQDYGLSEDTSDNLISSWRPSTRQQYWTYFKKWLLFCSQRKVDPFKATEIDVLNFLTHLYTSGLAYSTLNTVRCIFSSVLSIDKHVTIG